MEAGGEAAAEAVEGSELPESEVSDPLARLANSTIAVNLYRFMDIGLYVCNVCPVKCLGDPLVRYL